MAQEPNEPIGSVGPPGSSRRRMLFLAVSGAGVLAVLALTREVLLPFFLAVIVAYVLAPLVAGLERIPFGERRMPRWVAVVIVYAILLGLLSAFLAIGVPRLAAEIEKLARDAPEAVRTVRDEWIPEVEERFRQAMREAEVSPPPEPEPEPGAAPESGDHLAEAAPPAPAPLGVRVVPIPEEEGGGYDVRIPAEGIVVEPDGEGFRIRARSGDEPPRTLQQTLTEAIRNATENTEQTTATIFRTAQTVIRTVVRGVFTFFIMLMLSAYMLVTSDSIFGFLRSLARPRRRKQFDSLLSRIDQGLSGVVRGQLLIALVNGVLSGIGFYIADLQYWPILTLIATLLSIIPIFGAIISSVPAVIVGLQDGPGTAIFVLLWIIGIHQLEANLLNPKIMGDQAKVHPVLVVFALLAGEHVGGIAGALLAVPILSIVQSLFLHFREVALGGGPTRPTIPPRPSTPGG